MADEPGRDGDLTVSRAHVGPGEAGGPAEESDAQHVATQRAGTLTIAAVPIGQPADASGRLGRLFARPA